MEHKKRVWECLSFFCIPLCMGIARLAIFLELAPSDSDQPSLSPSGLLKQGSFSCDSRVFLEVNEKREIWTACPYKASLEAAMWKCMCYEHSKVSASLEKDSSHIFSQSCLAEGTFLTVETGGGVSWWVWCIQCLLESPQVLLQDSVKFTKEGFTEACVNGVRLD